MAIDHDTKPNRSAAARPLAAIGIDGSCYQMPLDELALDLQGWNSQHPIFEKVFKKHRPRLVCEIGTWKGASVLHMHDLAKKHGLQTHFVCVDTWLGSNDTLWCEDALRSHLRLKHGYPDLFRQFIFNVKAQGAEADVSPFPITSTAAARVFRKLGIQFEALYVDAGHEEEEVYFDLALFYDLVVDGGAIFGDDYVPAWSGVMAAVDKFCIEKGVALESDTGKFYFVKQPTRRSAMRTVLHHVAKPVRLGVRSARSVLRRLS